MSKIFPKIIAFLCFASIFWPLLINSGCEKNPSSIEASGFDTSLIWRIARYERSFADGHVYDTASFLNEHQKKHFPDIGLTVRQFAWGGELGGPWRRILHFKSDSTGKEQAFGFYDEYCFLHWRGCSAEECLRQIAIGRQLTELSRDLNYHHDSTKMNRLLTITMDSILAFKEIIAADTVGLKGAHIKKGSGTIHFGQASCTSDYVKKTMQKIVTDIRSQKARFFRGELTNGIWRVETKPSWRRKGTFEFEVTYLNHECVYILWM